MSDALTWFGTLVIKRLSMLLPRGFFLLSCACQEKVMKVWQIKVTRNYHIVELVTNFMQKIIEYIHPTWVFNGCPIAKTELHSLTSKRNNFG